ncbi:MAG: GtrA family protein [Clostridiales bacterium]|nr:GtrA family protein [Clostridiales bacterium]
MKAREGWIQRLLRGSFFRYVVVGATGALLDFAVFRTLLPLVQDSMPVSGKALANGTGMLLGALYCYTLNRIWSFKSRRPVLRQAAAYGGLLTFNVFASSGLIYLLGARTALTPSLCKIIAQGVIFLWNYLISRFWIFRQA